MSNARKCDRCGNLYEAYNVQENAKKPSGIKLLNIDSEGRYYQSKPLDLCPDCMKKITDIFFMKGEE